MSPVTATLWGALVVLALFYVWRWWAIEKSRGAGGLAPTAPFLGIGFGANFLDTLGVGSFATTAAAFRLGKLIRDEHLPGTLNAGHGIPTIAQALVFIVAIQIDPLTLVSMIAAAVLGMVTGARFVTRLPRRAIQLGIATALLVAAGFLAAKLANVTASGGSALGLSGELLAIGAACNFLLGALMALGIGLYAPCMILVALLGMDVTAAFPIMMGSCAFLMPLGSLAFIREGRYDAKAAIGLAIGGIPGVLLAAYVVESLPLNVLNWLVFVVVLYTATTLFASALRERAAAAAPATS